METKKDGSNVAVFLMDQAEDGSEDGSEDGTSTPPNEGAGTIPPAPTDKEASMILAVNTNKATSTIPPVSAEEVLYGVWCPVS
jgi:hypothetical protein